jgi:(E)-4-hydroxy-3-methylbut-2-enyl-diphosphate synthase
VSLTEDPNREIQVARDILQATGARRFSPEFVACPSCGRTSYDIQSVFKSVKEKIGKLTLTRVHELKIAVMGCIVNGLGEASDADYAMVGLPNGNLDIYKGGVCLLKGVGPELAADSLIKLILSDS